MKSDSLIKKFEGLKLTSYQDQGGVWTIGYGSTHYEDGTKVGPGQTIPLEEAERIFHKDLQKFENGVKELVRVSLNENQLAALTSFSYNLGLFNLKKSGLLKLLNQGKYNDAADQFLLWNKVGFYVSPGLTERRTQERTVFLTSVQ